MQRIQEIINLCKSIDAKQAEIERKAELENEGKFTDEQRTEYTALKAQYDTLMAEKKQLEADAAMRAARAGRAEELQPAALPRRTEPTTSTPIVQSGTPIEGTASDGESVIHFKIPRNIRRVGQPKNFSGTVNGQTAEERAYRFGMWALAKIANDLPARYQFPQATKFVNDYMGGVRNIAHSESDGTTGGHVLVPDEFSTDMIILRERYGVARRLFNRESMTSDVKHIPKRASGLTAYFVAENAAATESNMSWTDILLVAKDLVCLSRMSNQLSADAAISVGDTLAGEMSYAFSAKEDDAAFNGNGASTYGGIQGVRHMLTDSDGAGTNSLGMVIQATGTTWGAIVMGDFTNVVGILPQFADTPNAAWLCHRTFYAQVMLKLEVAQGGVTLAETATGDRRPRPMFLGYPVEFSQQFPSVTAATGVHVCLGDFSLGAIFGDRQQTSISFSDSATVGGESVFERNQIAIRGNERMDINVHGCGTSTVVGPIVGLAAAV